MKILDLYIIKKYIGTFLVMLGLFIPIGIMVDIAEKIDKYKENEVPTDKIIDYYIDFVFLMKAENLILINDYLEEKQNLLQKMGRYK